MGSKANNVIRIPCSIDNLFRYWLAFLSPFHGLTDRETDVAAALLRERWYLSKSILDANLLDMTLMSENVLRKVREELGLSNAHYQVIRNKLKQKKFLVDNKINRRLIPNIKEENGIFQLLLVFEYKDDE
jgi:hypothetical protein